MFAIVRSRRRIIGYASLYGDKYSVPGHEVAPLSRWPVNDLILTEWYEWYRVSSTLVC